MKFFEYVFILLFLKEKLSLSSTAVQVLNCPNKQVLLERHNVKVCACNEGYTFVGGECKQNHKLKSFKYREKNCKNDDECKQNETCINDKCHCKSGYFLNEKNNICEDANECMDRIDRCSKNSICRNTAGSYYCMCIGGYYLSADQKCIKMPECNLSFGCTGENYECKIVSGQKDGKCECKDGYETSLEDSRCIHINSEENNRKKSCNTNDECKSNIVDSFCIKTNSGKKCGCKKGFKLQSNRCVDINECERINPCDSQKEDCVNIPGGYRCDCKEGKHLTSSAITVRAIENCAIIEKDECDKEDADCIDDKKTCILSGRTKKCVCKEGYYTDPEGKCIDINECEFSPKLCQGKYEICKNTKGSYTCGCDKGYIKINDMCTASSSCRNDEDCGENEYCKHMKGRRNSVNLGRKRCKCKSGYRAVQVSPEINPGAKVAVDDDDDEDDDDDDKDPTKFTCQDVNECLIVDICPKGTNCINNVGSFSCVCPNGKIVDINARKNKNYCEDEIGKKDTCNKSTQLTITRSNNQKFCECKQGFYNDVDEYWLKVFNNVTFTYTSVDQIVYDCSDIDECALSISPCEVNDRCINIFGGFKCGKYSGVIEKHIYEHAHYNKTNICPKKYHWYMGRCRPEGVCNEYRNFCERAIEGQAYCAAYNTTNNTIGYKCECTDIHMVIFNGTCVDKKSLFRLDAKTIFMYSLNGTIIAIILCMTVIGLIKYCYYKKRYSKEQQNFISASNYNINYDEDQVQNRQSRFASTYI